MIDLYADSTDPIEIRDKAILHFISYMWITII